MSLLIGFQHIVNEGSYTIEDELILAELNDRQKLAVLRVNKYYEETIERLERRIEAAKEDGQREGYEDGREDARNEARQEVAELRKKIRDLLDL